MLFVSFVVKKTDPVERLAIRVGQDKACWQLLRNVRLWDKVSEPPRIGSCVNAKRECVYGDQASSD